MNRIGIDLGGTKIEGVALAADGTGCGARACRRRAATTTPRSRRWPQLVRRLERPGDGGCPVGMGTPGATSPVTGLRQNANSTWLNGGRLASDLAARLGRPVRAGNDADCFALSEATDGAAAGAASSSA